MSSSWLIPVLTLPLLPWVTPSGTSENIPCFDRVLDGIVNVLLWASANVCLFLVIESLACDDDKVSGCFARSLLTLPFELHLPGYHFTGPGTRLQERLEPMDSASPSGVRCYRVKPGSEPRNAVDAAALEHDLAYLSANDSMERLLADEILIEEMGAILKSHHCWEEAAAAIIVTMCMSARCIIRTL